eukprot:8872495-Pyramimonas_sp.AAC.1
MPGTFLKYTAKSETAKRQSTKLMTLMTLSSHSSAGHSIVIFGRAPRRYPRSAHSSSFTSWPTKVMLMKHPSDEPAMQVCN